MNHINNSQTPINTFSIVGRCARTNMLGIAIASKYLAVGSVCSHTQPHIGAIATQAYGNPYLGIDGLAYLRQGLSVEKALARLLEQDPGLEKRQVIIIDRHGQTAAHTGSLTTPWAGHQLGHNCVAAGNILVGQAVVEKMVKAFERSPESELAERLLAALEAGQTAGGDKRGKQAAHLQVVHQEEWKYVDLRVDEHPESIAELRRIYEVAKVELFPFRNLYPTRTAPGSDWNLTEYERIASQID